MNDKQKGVFFIIGIIIVLAILLNSNTDFFQKIFSGKPFAIYNEAYCGSPTTNTYYTGGGSSKTISSSKSDLYKQDIYVDSTQILSGFSTSKCSNGEYNSFGDLETTIWGDFSRSYSTLSNECKRIDVKTYYCPDCSPENSHKCDGKYYQTCSSGEWNSGSKVVGQCGVECTQSSECGTDGYIGSPTCSGSNRVQDYKTFSCSSNKCSNTISSKVIETCANGCENGLCKGAECSTGETKCSGTTYYACENLKWVNKGTVVGYCDYYSAPLQLGANQLIAMETLTNRPVSKTGQYSLRYPVVAWGGNVLPVIIVDGTGRVTTNSSIYSKLDAGQTLTIPASQTWSFFYVVQNNYQLPTVCQAVDVATGLCASINPGIFTVCTQGQFDPARGLCVVQVNASTYICPNGGRYDSAQGLCIVNPPINYVCTVGNLTRLSGGDYICTYNPQAVIVCPSGSTYNRTSGYCQYAPPSNHVCQSGFVYNPSTGYCEQTPIPTCVQGTYNASMNACVYTPNIQYLCLQGTQTVQNGQTVCLITPTTTIVCANGFTYNQTTDQCEKYPGYITINPGLSFNYDWKAFWDKYKLWFMIGGGVLIFVLLIGGKKR